MTIRTLAAALLLCASIACAWAAEASISGQLTDPQGNPVAGAEVRLAAGSDASRTETASDADGRFVFPAVPMGSYELRAMAADFTETTATVRVADSTPVTANLHFTEVSRRTEGVTVTADARGGDIQHPDPSENVNVRENLLDANPGRPGAPVSIPGLPIETASSGIKAPQYFAPGVAGDHGEPIAQYFQVGSFLLPNNLSANAHGNGYADPNIIVPAIIESVETDGGSFNVEEGNHAVNLAAVYGFRQRLEPFVTVTGDYRDIDVAAGWSPADPATRAFIALELAYGNGFLDTLEHRRQYKLNGFRVWDVGRHEITLFGTGYFGESKVPGLVPINIPGLDDTIDPRQRDQTHTAEIAVNDVWHLTPESDLQLSSFFRTYNLALYSNFGDGLIRQSEFRTVTGGHVTYVRKVNEHLSFLAGSDYLREAPRRLDLDRCESTDPFVYGPFEQVTSNNVTLNFLAAYGAIDGRLTPWLHYDLGWRHDAIDFDNTDLLVPANSYQKWIAVNSPKATLSLLPPEGARLLPTVAFSFGESFFTNDPRIGTGTTEGTPVSRDHAYQMVVSKTVLGTDFRVTLGHVTQEESLAKIDPDTGLQFNEGPSRNRYITVSARRHFRIGSIQSSVSKADARDLSDGLPVPEAPRMIVDFLGTLDRLPFQLHARAEFEEVGRKPLGDGFVSVPVREFRGALVRQFGPRLEAGINFLLASGYTGQTTEVLALPSEGAPFERVTGVYLPSYATLSVSYRFGRSRRP